MKFFIITLALGFSLTGLAKEMTALQIRKDMQSYVSEDRGDQQMSQAAMNALANITPFMSKPVFNPDSKEEEVLVNAFLQEQQKLFTNLDRQIDKEQDMSFSQYSIEQIKLSADDTLIGNQLIRIAAKHLISLFQKARRDLDAIAQRYMKAAKTAKLKKFINDQNDGLSESLGFFIKRTSDYRMLSYDVNIELVRDAQVDSKLNNHTSGNRTNGSGQR